MTTVFDGLPDAFTGALGRAVTLTPVGRAEPAVEITAIFIARPVDDLGVVQGQPALSARTEDVEDFEDGDIVTVGSTDYTFRTPEPDGRGMTRVWLEKRP